MLLIFLSLGFGQIPGVAIFLGLFIGYLGLSIAIGKSFIWIPESLRRKKISTRFLRKVIVQILRLLKFMRRWSFPRYVDWVQSRGTRILTGVMIALVGIFFAISPPIPFSSLAAFIAIFSMGIGLLNKDGVYIVFGYVCAFVYFILVVILLKFLSPTQLLESAAKLFSSEH